MGQRRAIDMGQTGMCSTESERIYIRAERYFPRRTEQARGLVSFGGTSITDNAERTYRAAPRRGICTGFGEKSLPQKVLSSGDDAVFRS